MRSNNKGRNYSRNNDMHSLEVHPLRSIQKGLPSIMLCQPRHSYHTPLTARREGTVLDEGAPESWLSDIKNRRNYIKLTRVREPEGRRAIVIERVGEES